MLKWLVGIAGTLLLQAALLIAVLSLDVPVSGVTEKNAAQLPGIPVVFRSMAGGGKVVPVVPAESQQRVGTGTKKGAASARIAGEQANGVARVTGRVADTTP